MVFGERGLRRSVSEGICERGAKKINGQGRVSVKGEWVTTAVVEPTPALKSMGSSLLTAT